LLSTSVECPYHKQVEIGSNIYVINRQVTYQKFEKRTAMEDKEDHPLGEKELLLNTMTCSW
jgi:hypothetical protein